MSSSGDGDHRDDPPASGHEAASPATDASGPAQNASGTVGADSDRPPSLTADEYDEAKTRIAGGSQTRSPEAEVVQPGTLINNNYRIIALISAGGMGEVYRGENIFTHDPVAIKLILPDLAQDKAVTEMLMHEARILVQLRDDAIVRYHNYIFDTQLRRHCLIMEFVEGRHLGQQLKEAGPLPKADALRIFRSIAAGLHRAHQRGVVHRDLSPDNVILRNNRSDDAVLIDFGIARSAVRDDVLGGRFAGKFRHVAPEQLGHFTGETDARADIYSLALLVAAMLRGEPLPMGGTAIEASMARLQIPDLSDVSYDVFPLLQYMLEPDPEARPADLGVVLAALDDPVLVPSHYRMPLWSSADQPEVDPSDDSESSSPFAHQWPRATLPPDADVQTGRKGRRIWPAILVGAALSLTGSAAWWLWPRAAPEPEKPEIMTVAELPPRDIGTRDGFLAVQELPPCTLATRVSLGAGAGTIRILSRQAVDTTGLATAWRRAFSTEPQISQRQIPDGFCPAIAFLAEITGRSASPLVLNVKSTRHEESLQIIGSLAGPEGANPWLFLLSPDGTLHDLTMQLTSGADNSWHFAISIAAPEGRTQDEYLMVAVSSAAPLITLAATPAAARAEVILPAILDEIKQMQQLPAVDFALVPDAIP
ncbi:MAG: serine/threonine-protein kinase [Paracoccus sp. (in: a-proteobacteria)]|uniref:serine/threonine-protein kinase n=1 Tax=Paracoccus sp. TaxID=267 RepID=UPI0026DFCBCC|nr:serine/threonine-protein kinase [Paracoccus sp. (in: a-proteobacteria)]MDO5622790.1 serine/threonine-protein kinase [Paracoccus sp. (in: a-proteobacteria)]